MLTIQIINYTNLTYQEIGNMIDYINSYTEGNTNYYGKISWCVMEIKHTKYRVTIQTLKKYTKFIIEEEKNEKRNRNK